jgi:hypothetical protein
MDHDSDSTRLYAPIPVGQSQSRLLRLHHGPGVGPLSADLLVANIESNRVLLDGEQRSVTYTALSYTWGTGPFSQDIMINGIPWRIKENLSDFLYQYRSNQPPEEELYLWIDALVINQADIDEKSRQVANMVDFYDKAHHVQVWLGNATRYTEDAVNFLHQLSADTHKEKEVISVNACDGLRDLYTRPWPTRMWIRQEVWAAKAISIQCGSVVMPLEVFKAGVIFSKGSGEDMSENGTEDSDLEIYSPPQRLGWLHEKLKINETQLAAISFLIQRPANQKSTEDRAVSGLGYMAMDDDGRKDILWLLYESVNYESTDIRDRVYALVGMCDDPDIEVDYRKTPAEVFTSLARHMIIRARSLGSVLDQSCKYGRHNKLDLPSWVPDWRSLNLIRYEWQNVTRCDMNSLFDSEKPEVLKIHGFLLGTVEEAKAEKRRAPRKVVRVDWTRIRDTLKRLNLLPDFLANPARKDTKTVKLNNTVNREINAGDSLVAAWGSDDFLLLRSQPQNEDNTYEFIGCVSINGKKDLYVSLLAYSIEHGVSESFPVV